MSLLKKLSENIEKSTKESELRKKNTNVLKKHGFGFMKQGDFICFMKDKGLSMGKDLITEELLAEYFEQEEKEKMEKEEEQRRKEEEKQRKEAEKQRRKEEKQRVKQEEQRRKEGEKQRRKEEEQRIKHEEEQRKEKEQRVKQEEKQRRKEEKQRRKREKQRIKEIKKERDSLTPEELAKRDAENFNALVNLVSEGDIRLPPIVYSPIICKKGEKVSLVLENISFMESKAVRATNGLYGGPSFRIARGINYKIGAVSTRSESHEEIKVIDEGTLTLTNKRLIFMGSKRNVNINLNKILAINDYKDGISINRENKQKMEYFTKTDGNMIDVLIDGEFCPTPLYGTILKAIIYTQIQ